MADAVNEKIATQGDKIRELKGNKADKAAIKAEVDVLLALKAEYKGITGTDWKPPGRRTTPLRPPPQNRGPSQCKQKAAIALRTVLMRKLPRRETRFAI
jgi:hypothetical protein